MRISFPALKSELLVNILGKSRQRKYKEFLEVNFKFKDASIREGVKVEKKNTIIIALWVSTPNPLIAIISNLCFTCGLRVIMTDVCLFRI